MFTVSYTKGLSESKKKVQNGYKSEKWSSVMFQTVFSGLLQCEKVSEVQVGFVK
ncbi:hypothetical protein YC2023_065035 [Brassica napus]